MFNYRGGWDARSFLLKYFRVFFTSPEDKLCLSPENSSQRTTPRCARFSRSHTRFSFLLPLWHSRNPLFKLKSKLLSLRRHPKAAKRDSREREACYPLWDVLRIREEKEASSFDCFAEDISYSDGNVIANGKSDVIKCSVTYSRHPLLNLGLSKSWRSFAMANTLRRSR